MNIRKHKRAQLMAEINITPFTDVVLVLLVIFMVTTPIILQSGIKVTLPKASSAEAESDKNLVITIDSAGNIFVEEHKVPLEDLEKELTAVLGNKPGAAVIIKGDKEVKYDTVIQVLDTAKLCGARKFALGVEVKK
ncbi:MAG: biopolymer transporter ExbD [Elusimicrobiota bacterium]